MTRAEIARQVAYYRSLRFPRKRIVYEIKRRLGARWNRRVLPFIDELIAPGTSVGAPAKAGTTKEAKKAAVIEALAKKYGLKARRGQRWISIERSTELAALERRVKALVSSLQRSGFGARVVRGDVGMWSDQLRYTKARGLELYASVTLYARRRPYRLELELCFA